MDFQEHSRVQDFKDLQGYKPIYEVVMGSHAYGTNTPESDVDIKGVYIVDKDKYITGDYKEQLELDSDTVFYEYSRFIHLLKSANPTVLEMLFVDDTNVLLCAPEMNLLLSKRNIFITKKCKDSFGGFGYAQIKKARGLDKKMNFEKRFTVKKEMLDFCYILTSDNKFISKDARTWLKDQGMHEHLVGLSGINHVPDAYVLYYDWVTHYKGEGMRPNQEVSSLNFKGTIRNYQVLTSSIPKYIDPEAIFYLNKNAWKEYHKKYKSYVDWLENRNTARYVDTKAHGQKIDGKNLLHAVRLVNVARDIGNGKGMVVKRPEYQYLVEIRKGKHDLEAILNKVTKDIEGLSRLFEESNLPLKVDKENINNLLLHIYGS